MKTIKVNLNSVNLWAKLSLLALTAVIMIQGKLFSQAPPVQWKFTSEYDHPYLGGQQTTSGADWLYNIIGTSDGGSLGVGFAVATFGNNPAAGFPAAVKLDATGHAEWMYVYQDNNNYNGLFYDVVELDGYYYMIGIKVDPAYPSKPGLVLVKIASDGTAQYYKYYHPGNLPDFATWNANHNPTPYPTDGVGNYTSINSYYDNNCNCNRLIIASSVFTTAACCGGPGIDRHQGAILINVELNGSYVSTFGPGGNQYGYQIFEYDETNNHVDRRTAGFYANKVVDPGTGGVTGFILTGSTLITPAPIATSGLHCGTVSCNFRNVYVVKTDVAGNRVWDNVFNENSIAYNDLASPRVCSTCDNESGSQIGRQVEQKPCTNDFIVLGEFDYNLCFGPCPTNTILVEATTTFDGVVFGVNGNTGAYSSSAFTTSLAENYGSEDFASRMVVLDDGSVMVCADVVNPAPYELEAVLVKLPPGGGSPVWKGHYSGSADEKCSYGLGQTLDNGFVLAGNNDENHDDFDVVKVGPDEIACSGYRTYTQGGYANNGVPGQYLLNHYNSCFSSGLIVGCNSNFTMKWTNKTDLRKFLKAHGNGPSVPLTANYTNLIVPHCEFEKQVVTLTLNVGLDRCDPCFGSAASHLDNLTVTFPPFNGLTVGQVLAEANKALGGCGSIYSLSNLNAVVTAINESFDPSGCNGNAYCNILSCPSAPGPGPLTNCDVKTKIEYTTKACRTQFYDETDALNGSVITGCYWDFGDGTSSNSRTPLHTYQLPGTYNVCLTDFAHAANPNNGSCQETKCHTVAIDEECLPGECSLIPDFYYETENCKVYFTDYTESGTNTTITHWAWSFGDGSKSSFENPVHTFAKPGTYKVCLTVYGTNGETECEMNICMDVVITEDCIPEVCAIIPDFHYVVNGCNLHLEDFSSSISTSITDWNWSVQGLGTFAGDQVDCIVPTAGTYKVCLSITGIDGGGKPCYDQICRNININGCTTPRLIESFSNDSHLAGDISYNVTPNPSAGNFELRIVSPFENIIQTELYNFYGQLIEERTISLSKGINKFVYDLSEKAKGIYSLKIYNDNESHLVKIAIQ